MRSRTKTMRVYVGLAVFLFVAAACKPTPGQVGVPRIAPLPTRNKQLIRKPPILTQKQKVEVAQKILSGMGQKATSLESPIVLDLFHLFVKSRATLVFNLPSRIDPTENSVEFPSVMQSNQSYAQVALEAPPPGIYLIDISVSGPVTTHYSLTTPNGVEMKMLFAFDDQHLFTVAVVKPGNPLPISVVVSASNNWYFNWCEISRIQ